MRDRKYCAFSWPIGDGDGGGDGSEIAIAKRLQRKIYMCSSCTDVIIVIHRFIYSHSLELNRSEQVRRSIGLACSHDKTINHLICVLGISLKVLSNRFRFFFLCFIHFIMMTIIRMITLQVVLKHRANHKQPSESIEHCKRASENFVRR